MSIAELPYEVADREYDSDILYEEVDGVRVELLPMSVENDVLANQLTQDLGAFVRSRRIGRAVHEVLFDLVFDGKTQRRRPDVAFVSYDRWSIDRKLPSKGNSWPVIPDLAVEYVSPNDYAPELMEKVREYFESGVREVWLVYQEIRMVQIYESLTTSFGLLAGQTLENRPLFPEFRYPVSSFFEEV